MTAMNGVMMSSVGYVEESGDTQDQQEVIIDRRYDGETGGRL